MVSDTELMKKGEVVLERLQVLDGFKVALLHRPAGDGLDHAAHQLLDRVLAFRRAHGAAEVLGGHNIGGLLAPALGRLDVFLLEDRATALILDDGAPGIPFELVVGMNAFGREEALEGEPLRSFFRLGFEPLRFRAILNTHRRLCRDDRGLRSHIRLPPCLGRANLRFLPQRRRSKNCTQVQIRWG